MEKYMLIGFMVFVASLSDVQMVYDGSWDRSVQTLVSGK